MPINVLVLCTGNSARSVLAECLINRLGQGQWHAYSAGSHPTGQVNPLTLAVLTEKGFDVSALRSKSWDEFADANAPKMDLIVTVCDNAAGEVCPIWPGHPSKLHVGFPDPAAAVGDDALRMAVFRQVYDAIEAKMTRLIALYPNNLAEV